MNGECCVEGNKIPVEFVKYYTVGMDAMEREKGKGYGHSLEDDDDNVRERREKYKQQCHRQTKGD